MTQTVRDPNQSRALGRRASIGLIIAAALMAVLAVRLYQLQMIRGEDYAFKSRSNFIKEVAIPADRGMILDRRGKIVVDNRPAFDVAITPAFCKDLDEVLGRLAGYLTLGPEEVQRVREHFRTVKGLKRFKPFVVKQDISRDELDKVEGNGADLAGVDILTKLRRNYRMGTMAAHLLGYMSEIGPEELEKARAERKDYARGDFIGRRGVEKRFEAVLRGKDGVERVVADAKGRRLSEADSLIPAEERMTPSVPGHNLVLSIDSRLQEAIEKAFPGKAGAVVALDPHSGFVLAMLSTPAYDPAKMSGRLTEAELGALRDDPLKPMLHRAVQVHYSPGSTFKIVTATAALAEGAAGPGRYVGCAGGYTMGGRRWRCHKEKGHGMMDLRSAIKYSCDTFFYAMADRLGLDKLARYASLFGFGKRTGIELTPEVPGFFPTSAWYAARPVEGTSKAGALNAAIGQGAVDVTPIQLAVAYAAIANGGHIYKPQIVRRVETAEGQTVQEFGPSESGTVPLKPAHLDLVREGLTAVVQEPGGTAHASMLAEVEVAGKTGTAQVVTIGEVREKNLSYWENDHAWFAAFAPAEQPEIVVVVLNEHGGHGGSAAAPTAMAAIKAWMELKKADEAERALRPPAPPPGKVRPSSPAPGPGAPAPEGPKARAG